VIVDYKILKMIYKLELLTSNGDDYTKNIENGSYEKDRIYYEPKISKINGGTYFITYLTTNEGKSYEGCGEVMENHFKSLESSLEDLSFWVEK
jgi:hypothetical protein